MVLPSYRADMTTPRIPAATLAAALVAAGLVAAAPAHADEERPRTLAACDYRICVYVLDALTDADGDGVVDLDEEYFATGVLDATSAPTGGQLVDAALERVLPSFERHLTELVVLPQVAEDRASLATALGSFPLPATPWDDDLSSSLAAIAKNGFTDILSGIGVSQPTAGDGGIRVPGMLTTHFSYLQLVSSGEGTTVFSFPDFRGGGVNEGRTDGRTGTDGPSTKVGDVTTSIRGGQVTVYPDGSEDVTTFSGSTATKADDGPQTVVTGFVTTSTNQGTGSTSKTTSTTKTTTDPKTGSTTSTTSSSTTTTTKDGTSTTTKTRTETKDGTTTSESSTETTDKDGNVIPTPHGESETHRCTGEKCAGGGRTDPDYVGVGPFSEADQARVIARLNSVRTPGPDTGAVLGDPPKVPPRDLYALYSGDGVITLSATPNPRFNSAQPEYHPGLRDLAPMAGVLPPDTSGSGYGYWPDKP